MSIPTAIDADNTDWRSRCNLAASILNQREPSRATAHLARLALDGSTIQRLMREDEVIAAIGEVA